MSRSARVFAPGSLQHICSRLVDRCGWSPSDLERARYLELLGRALERTDWKCIAYSLTGRELHFAMVAGTKPLDAWSKRTNVSFAHWLNTRHGWSGPVFAQRPVAREVARGHTVELLAALHSSDVEKEAPDSNCSSYQSYLGQKSSPTWLDIDEGLRRAGFYGQPALFDEAVRRLAAERRAVLYVPSGSTGDVRREEVTSVRILTIVADELGLSVPILRRRRTRGPSADAKSIAAHTARVLGVPLVEMANALGISRQRASQLAALDLAPEHRQLVARIAERLDVPVSLPSPR